MSTCARCEKEYKTLFSELGIPLLGIWTSSYCSTEGPCLPKWAFQDSLLIVFGFIVCASALRWSKMVLLCMIIDGLIILMKVHNWEMTRLKDISFLRSWDLRCNTIPHSSCVQTEWRQSLRCTINKFWLLWTKWTDIILWDYIEIARPII